MGPPSPEIPEDNQLTPRPFSEAQFTYRSPSSPYLVRSEPVWRYLILFVLTILSTTQAGGLHYVSFILPFTERIPNIPLVTLFVHGLWYSVSILAILGCHELGHYYACRYYRV